MKNKLFIICMFLIFILVSCSSENTIDNKEEANKNNEIIDDEDNNMKLVLKIDNNILDVNWENNNSVNELKKLAKNELVINMHEYGGFEQTGSIGKSVTRNDSNIDVIPGDIVLYNGNAISVFYNSSSWSYTRLGHINLSDDELKNLLKKDNVKFVLKLE